MQTEVLGTPVAVLVQEHGGFTRAARDAGIDDAVLYRAMHGQANPSYATRLKLARVFRCRVDEVSYPADMEQS